MDIEIERHGNIEQFQVSPILSTLIWHFQNTSKYCLV